MAIKRLRDLEGSEIDGDSIRTANFLLQLSRGDGDADAQEGELSGRLLGRVFECKTCNRQFGSFQALGGHRASHKKPRIVDGHYKQSLQVKPKVHECSICGLEFAIGQALGGHMRRHRNGNEGFPVVSVVKKEERKKVYFDLNLPASEEPDQLGFGVGLVPMMSIVH